MISDLKQKISNKRREWNNCFIKFLTLVIVAEFGQKLPFVAKAFESCNTVDMASNFLIRQKAAGYSLTTCGAGNQSATLEIKIIEIKNVIIIHVLYFQRQLLFPLFSCKEP